MPARVASREDSSAAERQVLRCSHAGARIEAVQPPARDADAVAKPFCHVPAWLAQQYGRPITVIRPT